MQKSLKIKAFDYPFYYNVSRLLRAKQHTPRDAFVDSKGSGNLLRIICILPTSLHIRHVLRAFFYTNRRKGVKMIFK